MDDDGHGSDYERRKPSTPAAGQLSKTPSWVMLGFVLGAATAISLPPWRKPAPAPPAPAVERRPPPAKPEGPREPARLTTIEAVFEDWRAYAVWDFNTTEVALWNAETREFSDYFEVLRYADRYYYRSIPALTRRIVERGKALPNCPLKFTETEEQYQEWRRTGRTQQPLGDYRPLSAFAPAEAGPGGPGAVKPELQKVVPPAFETISPIELPKAVRPPETKK